MTTIIHNVGNTFTDTNTRNSKYTVYYNTFQHTHLQTPTQCFQGKTLPHCNLMAQTFPPSVPGMKYMQ